MSNNMELATLKNKLQELSSVEKDIEELKKKIDKTSCDVNSLTNIQVEGNFIGHVSAEKINKSINSLKLWAGRCFHLILNAHTDQNKNIEKIAKLIKILAEVQVVIHRDVATTFSKAANIEEEINRLCINANITDKNLQDVLRISAKQAYNRQLEMSDIKMKLFEIQEYQQQQDTEIRYLKVNNTELLSMLEKAEEAIEQLKLNICTVSIQPVSPLEYNTEETFDIKDNKKERSIRSRNIAKLIFMSISILCNIIFTSLAILLFVKYYWQ